MSEPRRLLEEEGTDFERALLRSAKGDAASPALRQKTLAALGLSAGAACAGTAAAAKTAQAGGAALLKWIGIGVASGVVTVGALTVVPSIRARLSPPAALQAPAAAAAPSPRLAPGRAEARAIAPVDPDAPPAEDRSIAPEDRAAPAEAPAPDARAEPARPRPSAELARATLADEIALLDAAREAIAAGDAPRALQTLDKHDRAFPRAPLGPEAMVLRIEATALRGDRAGAARLGGAFLAAHPNSPHASRVRSLLGVTDAASSAPPSP